MILAYLIIAILVMPVAYPFRAVVRMKNAQWCKARHAKHDAMADAIFIGLGWLPLIFLYPAFLAGRFILRRGIEPFFDAIIERLDNR